MKLRVLPNSDKVVVEILPDPAHALDAGDAPTSIVIPEAHRRESAHGRVLAVGNGHYTKRNKWIPTTVKPGDVVLLPIRPDVATVLRDSQTGVEYRELRESEILGVVE